MTRTKKAQSHVNGSFIIFKPYLTFNAIYAIIGVVCRSLSFLYLEDKTLEH
jgi:hypothetical protein